MQNDKTEIVTDERLSELMDAAQREGHTKGLREFLSSPFFGLVKLHFFITDVLFIIFLIPWFIFFSLGIYAQYLEDSTGFLKNRYIALFKDHCFNSQKTLD